MPSKKVQILICRCGADHTGHMKIERITKLYGSTLLVIKSGKIIHLLVAAKSASGETKTGTLESLNP